MTVEELRERTRHLEQALNHLLRDFEEESGCRIKAVQVVEDGPEIYDMEARVRLRAPPQRVNAWRKLLEGVIKDLLRNFEEETGCRVVEIQRSERGMVALRLDPLPYPQRFRGAANTASIPH